MNVVTVVGVAEDHGTVVTFVGRADDGATIVFAVDHRIAQRLVDDLVGGRFIRASLDDWQILSRIEPTGDDVA